MSFSVNTLNHLNRSHQAMNSSMQRIASGSKYSSAADNSAAYSILARMYSNIGTVSQANTNTQNANAMLATAAGGVDSTVQALGSLQESLLKAANGTNSESDLQAISKQVNQTIDQINENASIQFNGKNLLDGSQSVAVAGEHGYTNVGIGNMTAKGLGLVDENGKSLIDMSSLDSALETVSNAFNKALDQATSLGAAQQGLNYASANYTVEATSLLDSASNMGASNIAEEVTKLSSDKTMNQLALYATKLNMHNNAAVLSLLQ